MKIAVTTASGQLGSHIILSLIEEVGPNQVVGIARTPANAQHLGVEIRKGDYNQRVDFDQALQGIDAVLLVSSNSAPEDRIQQHRNVIEAAKAQGVKKIVYTSIIGDGEETDFSPIIQSNRNTELDIQNSGLDWVIGRNGLYLDPDLEYIEQYIKDGVIANCAGEGRCAYTSRKELGVAYAKMLLEDKHQAQVYNLVGEPITQTQLAELINQLYGTSLRYEFMEVKDYLEDRQKALGAFLGMVIAGIYAGIKNGSFDVESDFEKATGRAHQSVLEMIRAFKEGV